MPATDERDTDQRDGQPRDPQPRDPGSHGPEPRDADHGDGRTPEPEADRRDADRRDADRRDGDPRAADQVQDEEESGLKGLISKVMASRVMRAFQRYGKARGALLAGGIAYSALFSIVAALTIAWTVFMATLGGNAQLRSSVIQAVNQVLPSILEDGSGGGMINPDSLVLDSAINPASIIAALVLLWTSIGMMTNIRQTVQDMFGIVAPVENFAVQKLRDLGGFIAMALGIVGSALLGTAAGTMGGTIAGWIGLGDNPVISFLVRVLGLLVAALVAAGTFAFLFRVTAAVRPLRRDMLIGCGLGGVAVQIVLALGTGIVSSVSDDPLLAASASLATLLLFVNLLSRVLLLVAAFTANPPAPVTPQSDEEVHFKETPNFVTESAEHTLDWEYQDVTGQVGIDENLRYGKTDPVPDYDVRPDGKPIDKPEYLGWFARRRAYKSARKHELAAVKARARLGQRPRIETAEKEYWAEQGVEAAPRRR